MNGSKGKCYDSYGCTKEHDRQDKGRFCKLPPKPDSPKLELNVTVYEKERFSPTQIVKMLNEWDPVHPLKRFLDLMA